MYLSLGVSLSCSFVIVSELFCEVFETYTILPVILLPIKLPVASVVFVTALFKLVLITSVADCLA